MSGTPNGNVCSLADDWKYNGSAYTPELNTSNTVGGSLPVPSGRDTSSPTHLRDANTTNDEIVQYSLDSPEELHAPRIEPLSLNPMFIDLASDQPISNTGSHSPVIDVKQKFTPLVGDDANCSHAKATDTDSADIVVVSDESDDEKLEKSEWCFVVSHK